LGIRYRVHSANISQLRTAPSPIHTLRRERPKPLSTPTAVVVYFQDYSSPRGEVETKTLVTALKLPKRRIPVPGSAMARAKKDLRLSESPDNGIGQVLVRSCTKYKGGGRSEIRRGRGSGFCVCCLLGSSCRSRGRHKNMVVVGVSSNRGSLHHEIRPARRIRLPSRRPICLVDRRIISGANRIGLISSLIV